MRIEAFIKNKHHPVVTFHNNYDYSTPLERFWEDLCRNNMTKPMPSGSGSRMVELRFVYQGCIDSVRYYKAQYTYYMLIYGTRMMSLSSSLIKMSLGRVWQVGSECILVS